MAAAAAGEVEWINFQIFKFTFERRRCVEWIFNFNISLFMIQLKHEHRTNDVSVRWLTIKKGSQCYPIANAMHHMKSIVHSMSMLETHMYTSHTVLRTFLNENQRTIARLGWINLLRINNAIQSLRCTHCRSYQPANCVCERQPQPAIITGQL